MRALRQARWFSAAVTCVAALAWLFATNHCAFATLAAHSPKIAHACCHEETVPHSQPTLPPAMQCCDTLKAALPTHALAPAAPMHELQPAWIAVETSAPTAAARNVLAASATGPPPRAATFVEIVLNRSQPAHAPPVFVA
jgi:hypothetical protein